MRGSQIIYQSLIDAEPEQARKRHRNNDALIQRNELILHRYYYYIILKKRQYTDTLTQLEREHFIATRTIVDIIMQCHAQLKELKAEPPDERELRNRWPWLVW